MRTIPLRGKTAAGRVALVDDEDYDLVMQYRWWVWEPKGKSGGPYAQAKVGAGRGASKAYMHKLITGWPMTDHIDHDGLNNQRSNLRLATGSQNHANQRPIRPRVSRFKGVTPRYGRWQAYITGGGRRVSLGVYDDEVEAALAYDAGARHYFGEFACLNFPDSPGSLAKVAQPRLCVICQGFIDPIDFCSECADLARKCDVHPRPRRNVDAETCSTKCQNARRYVKR